MDSWVTSGPLTDFHASSEITNTDASWRVYGWDPLDDNLLQPVMEQMSGPGTLSMSGRHKSLTPAPSVAGISVSGARCRVLNVLDCHSSHALRSFQPVFLAHCQLYLRLPIYKKRVCIRAKWPIRLEFIPASVAWLKRLEVFLLPLDGMLVHRRQGYPQHQVCQYPFIHLGGESNC